MPSRASTKAKGDRFEIRIRDFLESLGWVVERAHPKTKYIGPGVVRNVSHDIYGAFDFIAFHRKLPVFIMIQATTSETHVSEKKRTINQLMTGTMDAWAHYVQIWVKDDTARGRIIVWDRANGNGGWVETSFRMEPGCWPNAVLGTPPENYSGLLAIGSVSTNETL